MKDQTKQWLNEAAYAIYYLLVYEPELSWKGIKKEVQPYYDLNNNEFKTCAKIAERWERYGYNN